MKRYFATIFGPLLVLLCATVIINLSPFTDGVIMITTVLEIGSIAWAGWLLATRLKIPVSSASFSGPLLLFIDLFLFGYLPSLALGRFSSIPQSVSIEHTFANPQVALFVVFLIGYAICFPLSLAIAALGAYLGVRDNRNALKEQSSV